MTVSSELDAWVTALATATGMAATRDPDLIHPPVLFVSTPETVGSPLTGQVMELPVYVIGEGSGKAGLDSMLDALPAVLDATGQVSASLSPIEVGGIAFNAYLITVPVILDRPTVTPIIDLLT